MSKEAQSSIQEPLDFQDLPPPTGSGEPNRMVYKDNEGAEHTICIPLGQFQIACQYFIDKNWDALGKFPQPSKYHYHRYRLTVR
jgi:hypothetical protein